MTTTAPASLEMRSLDVTIDQHQILRDIDLSVLPGELFVVLGGAGSGKSTLLRAIAGLDPVSAGELWIDDLEITKMPVDRRKVGTGELQLIPQYFQECLAGFTQKLSPFAVDSSYHVDLCHHALIFLSLALCAALPRARLVRTPASRRRKAAVPL